MSEDAVRKTPLHALHVELGARMAPFAGYDMPIQYPTGVLAEHLHTRKAAGLFDVSHMGQALIEGADHARVAAFLETLCPADLVNLAPGRQRYTQLLNERGGIVDDLMVARPLGADGAVAARGQRLAQGRRFRADSRAPAQGRAPHAARGCGADRASGTARRGDPGAPRARRGDAGHGLHERQARADRRIRDLRLPLRLHGRGRLRDLACRRRRPRCSPAFCLPSRMSRRSGLAHAIR